MVTTEMSPFYVVGVSVRTSNQEGRAAKDIPALWARFMEENVLANIPNKIDDTIYAIYTNYEGDHMLPYDTVIGCKVSTLDHIPEGMVSLTIKGGTYAQFEAKGDLEQGAVINTWFSIWQTPLNRTYATDFEVYGEKAMDKKNAEIPIFVGVNAN